MHTKQTEVSQKQSEQTKIFKISYYIIWDVLKNEMIKRIEVRCTATTWINLRRNLNLDLGIAQLGDRQAMHLQKLHALQHNTFCSQARAHKEL